jgi:hypothetical protein
MMQENRRLFGEAEQYFLIFPTVGKHRNLSEPFNREVNRLGAVEDRFDDVGSQES